MYIYPEQLCLVYFDVFIGILWPHKVMHNCEVDTNFFYSKTKKKKDMF